MLKSCQTAFFLATTDAKKCLAFYQNSLALELIEDSDYALVFALNGAELRISKLATFTPHPFTVLDWQVDDLAVAMAMLKDKNIIFEIFKGMGQDENGVWHVPGSATKIVWFKDPDGNLLSLSQRA